MNSSCWTPKNSEWNSRSHRDKILFVPALTIFCALTPVDHVVCPERCHPVGHRSHSWQLKPKGRKGCSHAGLCGGRKHFLPQVGGWNCSQVNIVTLWVRISCSFKAFLSSNSLSLSLSPPVSHVFSEGSNLTPAHHYSDFRFKTYAPIAFRYFRELFGIRPDDYLVSTYTKHYQVAHSWYVQMQYPNLRSCIFFDRG